MRHTPDGLPRGYTVRYHHERNQVVRPDTRMDQTDRVEIDPKGGKTVCTVYGPEGLIVCKGVAVCHPKECYRKDLGRRVALGRAIKAFECHLPNLGPEGVPQVSHYVVDIPF
jgi:hypothetical protein